MQWLGISLSACWATTLRTGSALTSGLILNRRLVKRPHRNRKETVDYLLERLGKFTPEQRAEAWKNLIEWLEEYCSPANPYPLRYRHLFLAIWKAGLRSKKLHGNS